MAQQSVTPLKGLLDAQTQQEVTKHAGDEWRTFENLPPGINNGIGKLMDIQFKQYDTESKKKKVDGSSAAGEWYVQFVGTVMFPFEVPAEDGKPFKCWGKQTRQQVPLFDQQWKDGLHTKAEMVRRAMDEMKKLADNQYLFCNPDRTPKVITEQLLEQTAQALVKLSLHPPEGKHGLFFHFTTTKTGNYVNENWNGGRGLSNYVPTKPPGRGVTSGTSATQPAASQPPPTQPPATATAAASTPESSVDQLVKLSYGDPTDPQTSDAQTKLINMAVAAGHPQDEIEWDGSAPLSGGRVGCKTWEDIAARIKNPKQTTPAANSNGTPSTNGDWPQKGDLVRFVKAPLIDGRTKQPIPGKFRKVECEVTDRVNDVFDLLDFNDRITTYGKVAKADLEPV